MPLYLDRKAVMDDVLYSSSTLLFLIIALLSVLINDRAEITTLLS
ncbi:hypothetical protein [Kiloniella majae]|nr:hypothetical protein [Kiloniella majae]